MPKDEWEQYAVADSTDEWDKYVVDEPPIQTPRRPLRADVNSVFAPEARQPISPVGIMQTQEQGLFLPETEAVTTIGRQLPATQESGRLRNRVFAERAYEQHKEQAPPSIREGRVEQTLRGKGVGSVALATLPFGNLFIGDDESVSTAIPKGQRVNLANQFGADIVRGVDQLQSIGYALVGMGGDVVGNERVKKFGLKGYLANMEEAKKNPSTIGSYKNIEDAEDVLRYVVESIGENGLMMLPSLVTGGVGAKVGQEVGKRLGYYVAKQGMKAGLSRGAAEIAAKNVVAKATQIGLAIGSYTGATALETGSIYGDIYERTGETAPGTAIGYGTVAGALEALPNLRLLNRWLKPQAAKEVAKGIIRRVGVEGAKQFTAEGITELAQTIVEEAAVKRIDPSVQLTSPEAVDNYINAFLKGASSGGVMGGASETGIIAREKLGKVFDRIKRKEVQGLELNQAERNIKRQNPEVFTDTGTLPELPEGGIPAVEEQLVQDRRGTTPPSVSRETEPKTEPQADLTSKEPITDAERKTAEAIKAEGGVDVKFGEMGGKRLVYFNHPDMGGSTATRLVESVDSPDKVRNVVAEKKAQMQPKAEEPIITREQKRDLVDAGFTVSELKTMKPEEAKKILGEEIAAQPSVETVKGPSVVEQAAPANLDKVKEKLDSWVAESNSVKDFYSKIAPFTKGEYTSEQLREIASFDETKPGEVERLYGKFFPKGRAERFISRLGELRKLRTNANNDLSTLDRLNQEYGIGNIPAWWKAEKEKAGETVRSQDQTIRATEKPSSPKPPEMMTREEIETEIPKYQRLVDAPFYKQKESAQKTLDELKSALAQKSPSVKGETPKSETPKAKRFFDSFKETKAPYHIEERVNQGGFVYEKKVYDDYGEPYTFKSDETGHLVRWGVELSDGRNVSMAGLIRITKPKVWERIKDKVNSNNFSRILWDNLSQDEKTSAVQQATSAIDEIAAQKPKGLHEKVNAFLKESSHPLKESPEFVRSVSNEVMKPIELVERASSDKGKANQTFTSRFATGLSPEQKTKNWNEANAEAYFLENKQGQFIRVSPKFDTDRLPMLEKLGFTKEGEKSSSLPPDKGKEETNRKAIPISERKPQQGFKAKFHDAEQMGFPLLGSMGRGSISPDWVVDKRTGKIKLAGEFENVDPYFLDKSNKPKSVPESGIMYGSLDVEAANRGLDKGKFLEQLEKELKSYYRLKGEVERMNNLTDADKRELDKQLLETKEPRLQITDKIAEEHGGQDIEVKADRIESLEAEAETSISEGKQLDKNLADLESFFDEVSKPSEPPTEAFKFERGVSREQQVQERIDYLRQELSGLETQGQENLFGGGAKTIDAELRNRYTDELQHLNKNVLPEARAEDARVESAKGTQGGLFGAGEEFGQEKMFTPEGKAIEQPKDVRSQLPSQEKVETPRESLRTQLEATRGKEEAETHLAVTDAIVNTFADATGKNANELYTLAVKKSTPEEVGKDALLQLTDENGKPLFAGVAIKVGDTVYRAKKRDFHAMLLDEMTPDDQMVYLSSNKATWEMDGFIRPDGTFITRRQASEIAGRSVQSFNVPLYQEEVEKRSLKPFFSQLTKSVEELKQEKWNGQQLLNKLTQTAGVKKEELAWTGLDEFLKSKPNILRQEVLDYLRDNEVIVEEKVLGGDLPSPKDVADIQRIVDLEKATETKFSSYQEPGAKEGTYRELLLTLPSEKFNNTDRWTARRQSSSHPSAWTVWDENGKQVKVSGRDLFYGNDDATAIENASKMSLAKAQFRSSHFDEPNIVAHIRFNEREVDGKKIMFVEEFQSDFGQALRKERQKISKLIEDSTTFERIVAKMNREKKLEIRC